MTDTPPPDDLVGELTDVQAAFRARYAATEVKLKADDWTSWRETDDGSKLERRETGIAIVLTYVADDIPPGDETRPTVLQHLNYANDKRKRLTEDFPAADGVSTKADEQEARVRLQFEDWASIERDCTCGPDEACHFCGGSA